MNLITTIAASLCAISLSSCATKFTARQKASLTSVAISDVSVRDGAYSQPSGADRAAVTNTAIATGGGLVGLLIGESIAATQNNIFKGNNKQYFETVKSNTPEISAIVSRTLGSGIKNDPFFGQRLQSSSPNLVKSEVVRYGLVRSGKQDDGTLLLTPLVSVSFTLHGKDGKKMAGKNYMGTGYNHPVEKYSKDRKEIIKGYEMATRVAVDQFTADLARMAAD